MIFFPKSPYKRRVCAVCKGFFDKFTESLEIRHLREFKTGREKKIFVAKILRKKYNEPVLYKIDKKDGVYRNDSIIILSIPPARSLQGFGISKTLQI